jgi:hypothetical protein
VEHGDTAATGSGARGARRNPARTGREDTRTEGTAALKLDTAVAEPQRVTRTAPRLQVAPPAPISAPRAPFIAVMIALVIAGVLGILLVNTKTNENSFQISKLQDEQTTLDNQQQQLENQLAHFESVGNLDALAKAQGLVRGTPAWIRLPDGKVIGVPKPATGEPAVTAQDEADAVEQDAAKAQQGPANAQQGPANTQQDGAGVAGSAAKTTGR